MEEFDLTEVFMQMIPAIGAGLAYVALFFTPKLKALIPPTVRPLVPSVLSLIGGTLSGLVGDATSALAAAAIGMATSIIYDVAKKWGDTEVPKS